MVATSNDILVFGATGTIGKFILNALIENKSAFGTIGIFTSAATTQSKAVEIESLKDRGVKVYIGDLKSDGDVLSAYQSKSALPSHDMNLKSHFYLQTLTLYSVPWVGM